MNKFYDNRFFYFSRKERRAAFVFLIFILIAVALHFVDFSSKTVILNGEEEISVFNARIESFNKELQTDTVIKKAVSIKQKNKKKEKHNKHNSLREPVDKPMQEVERVTKDSGSR